MKKLVTVLALSLLFVSLSFGQYLARDGISAATTAVHALSPDATMRMIVNLQSPVTAAGRCGGWMYHFCSPTTHNWYSAMYVGTSQAFPGGINDSVYVALPATFVDSDVAMATAESNGGAVFRQNNPTATIMLMGATFVEQNGTIPAGTPLWIANYGSNNNQFAAVMYMSNGNLIVATDVNEHQYALLPGTVELKNNYPNPFNSQTTLQYSLPTSGNVSLSIFDASGREIASMNQGNQTAGDHSVSFKADAAMPSGQYFVRLQSGKAVRTMPMMYLK